MARRPHNTNPLNDDRLDDLVRAAAAAGPVESGRESDRGGGLPLVTRVLLASGVLAAAAVGVAFVVTGVPATTPATPGPQVADATPADPVGEETDAPIPEPTAQVAAVESDPSAVRRSVVLARFTPEESAGMAALFETPAPAPAPAAEPTPNVDGAPAIVAASPEPAAASDEQLMALGRLLRSAEAARDTLALMSPGEQLEACRLWAAEPSLRPFAFERLSDLSMNPAVADDVRRAATAMASDPALSPWLQSYGLAMGDAVPTSATPRSDTN